MSEPILDVQDLGFRMPLYTPQDQNLSSNPLSLVKEFYRGGGGLREQKEILTSISFTLSAGQKIGLIGANGAGKSTLLRIIGGIYEPTAGRITRRGRVHGLFDMATGFLPDATGLENIYLRCLERGQTIKEVRQQLPSIVDFSGLGSDIEKPFASYSSGMRLRLSVALALSVDPDILLLDEWIGAGDAEFQKKVTARMNELVSGARGLMLASHQDVLLKRICTHGLVLRQGRLLFSGEIGAAIDYYHAHVSGKTQPQPVKTQPVSATAPVTAAQVPT